MATDTEVHFWRGLTSLTVMAVVGGLRWIFNLASRQREHESWRSTVESRIDRIDSESSGTHDAVLILKTNVEHLTDDVTEIKDGQKTILARLADLLSR